MVNEEENILNKFFAKELSQIILDYVEEISTTKFCLHYPFPIDEMKNSSSFWPNIHEWVKIHPIYKTLFIALKSDERSSITLKNETINEIAKMYNIQDKEISSGHFFFASYSPKFYSDFTWQATNYFFFQMWKTLENQRKEEKDVLPLLINLFREIIIIIGVDYFHTKPLMALLFIVGFFESFHTFKELEPFIDLSEFLSSLQRYNDILNFLPWMLAESETVIKQLQKEKKCVKQDYRDIKLIIQQIKTHIVIGGIRRCELKLYTLFSNSIFSEDNVIRTRKQLIQFWYG